MRISDWSSDVCSSDLREHAQYVFVDTPGFQTRHGGAMNRMMNRVVTQALAQVDVVAHVVEAGKWSPGDAQLLPLLPKGDKTILVVNKVDAIKNKNDMFAYVGKIMEQKSEESGV